MTLEKVIYKCECGYKEGFDEDVKKMRNISDSTIFLLRLKEYPSRICEKCGQEMGV